MNDLDELIKEFLVESGENLDRLDQDFVALEKDPAAQEQLKSIFRTIHTIKGTCGFFGFAKLESVAHVGESLLGRLQAGHVEVTSEVITALLRMVDVIRAILAHIGADGTEGATDPAATIAELTRLNEGASACAPLPPLPPMVHDVLANLEAVTTHHDAAPTPDGAVVVATAAAAPAPSEHAAANAGIRVDVGLLDRLMNLVGELVLARNQILQYAGTHENAALVGPTQRLNLITTELQEGVMKTRMQPIGNVWSKFPRIVRDLAQMCGKQVRVEMDGKETELDKTIVEAIKDPLTHIIRNSVDHGIETAQRRAEIGKPTEGCLSLQAFHEGGQVNIEIRDDGNGIDVERVKRKAAERGLITHEQAARMGEREATNLIFLPGFSTAEKVTNVSGRGVGMDVVKTNIERIGGTVDVQSTIGAGTTLRIKIPLTLAIIPALIVSSAGQRYAIPQVSLLELVRLEPDPARGGGVERVHGTPVYRLRGNLLPLVYLNQQLAAAADDAASSSRRVDAACNIVVVHADGVPFGLIVDEINDTEEIVVKPLGKQLKGLTTFAGATIMGDGRIALILDVMGLAQRADVVGAHREAREHEDAADGAATGAAAGAAGDVRTLLLFQVPPNRRMAAPLSSVARLEEFAPGAVESAGDHDVVQYRGRIMPLLHISSVVAERRARPRRLRAAPAAAAPAFVAPPDTLQVIVYADPADATRTVGLVVDKILDIVEASVDVQPAARRPGVLGSAIVQDRVTEILDVASVVRLAFAADRTADVDDGDDNARGDDDVALAA